MIKEVDAQCVNWMWWVRGAGVSWPGPKDVRSWWGPLLLDPNMGNPGVPGVINVRVNVAAAEALHYRIKRLETRLRRALRQHYLKGGTKEQKARACGCSPAAFYNWLHEAHTLLAEMADASPPAAARGVVRTMETLQLAYPEASCESLQRYMDLRDEGHQRHAALVMAGLRDPDY